MYGSTTPQDRLRALDATFGAAIDDDFDGLYGEDYVERNRRGLAQRLRDTITP